MRVFEGRLCKKKTGLTNDSPSIERYKRTSHANDAHTGRTIKSWNVLEETTGGDT